MKKLLIATLAIAMLASVGCHIADYPVITDTRGDYNGVIRTGHRAYVTPTSQIATIFANGSDELLTLVYQNQAGDQKLYTKNNFDPTASVTFVAQTYCDWRFEECVIATSWNPASGPDNTFDFDGDANCLGYRSLSILLSQGSRLGECGDINWNQQDMLAQFANLPVSTWRGGTAYVVSINAGNTDVTLTAGEAVEQMGIFGEFNFFINQELQTVIPVTPNARHELRQLQAFTQENGEIMTAELSYGSLVGTLDLRILADNIAYNLNRF